MTLRKDQLRTVEERITKEMLGLGKTPRSEDIQRLIKEELVGREIGSPSFKHTALEAYEQSDPNSFNKEFTAIEEDVHTAFSEMLRQRGRASSLFENYEAERKKLEVRIKRQAGDIDRLDKMVSGGYKHIFREDFQNLEQTESNLIDKHNAERTSAFVNLKEGNATLSPLVKSTLFHRVDPGRTKIKDITSSHLIEIDTFSNALDGYENTAWTYVKKTNEETAQEIRIEIDLEEPVYASKLQLTTHSIKSTNIEVEVTLVDDSLFSLGVLEVSANGEWFFDKEVKALRLIMKKEEADEEENGKFIYHFGLSTLQLKRESYSSSGAFVSNTFDITAEDVEEINLVTRDVVYPDTELTYYIGFERDVSIDWQRIEKNATLRIQKKEFLFEEVNDKTERYGVLHSKVDGIMYHEIGRHEGKVSASIIAGLDMWKRERKSNVVLGEEGLPSPGEWRAIRGFIVDYIHIEDTMITSQSSIETTVNSLERYSINVESSNGAHVLNQSFHMTEKNLQVYLNGQPLYPSKSKEGGLDVRRYNYRLRKGTNKIEIIVYTGEEPSVVKPNIQFGIEATRITAEDKPMVERPLEDLLHNTSKRDLNFYATDPSGSLVVNYNPTERDLSGRGVKYGMTYKKKSSANESMKIRFMAVFSRKSENVTPVLKSYEIKVK